MKKDDREMRRMLGEPKKAIRSLAAALSLSYLVIQLNIFVDTFWTSGLGDMDMTAVSMMSPIYWIITATGVGLGVGAASTISFRIGEGNMERAEKLAANSVVLGLLTSVFVSAAMMLLIDPIIDLMGADEVRDGSVAYVFPFIAMGSALILNGIISGLLRSEGAGRKSMIVLIVSATLNIALDPVLIYGLGMGVAGAGWATSVGALISTALGLYWYMSGRMNVALSFRGFRPDRGVMAEVMGIGGPRTAEALVTGTTNILQRIFIIAAGGTVAVMLYNVPFRYPTLAIVPAEAIGAAMIPVCSAALGQKDTAKMKLGMLYSAKLSIAITSAIALTVFVFADPLMGVFTTSESMASHKEELVWVLRMFCIFIPFDGLRKLGSCMLQVLRRSKLSTAAMLLWGVCKLTAYAAASLYSFEALIIACVGVYVFGGILMMGLSYHVSKKVDERHMPREPGC